MKKKNSLKWKIAKYLTVFGVALLSLLVVFQFVLLQPMYEKYKIATLRSAASDVEQSIQKENLKDEIYKISARDDVCVRIISNHRDIVAGNFDAPLYRMNTTQIFQQVLSANDHGGEVINQRDNPFIPTNGEGVYKDITLTRLVETNNQQYVIMVYTGLTPVNATTKTLQLQFFYIGFFVILACVLMTYFMNRFIANPLGKINEEAKSLSKGEYNKVDIENNYTEVQELNKTLIQASSDLQKADRAKRDLIANVSHDLRTPLTMIHGYGEMMLDLPDEKSDENIQVIVDESERLSYLVNDLIDLAKMEEHKITLQEEVFDMSSMIEKQFETYNHYLQKEGYEVETSIEENLFVKGDIQRLQQVFHNFVSNAIHYGGLNKYIKVNVYEKDGYVVVEVSDHGEGIAKDQLQDIWERYYKVDKEHTRNLQSSGIGLSIAKEILKMHDAKYGVTSKVKEGSTFYFALKKVIQK